MIARRLVRIAEWCLGLLLGIMLVAVQGCTSFTPKPYVCASPPPQPTGFLKVNPKDVVEGKFYVALKQQEPRATAQRPFARMSQADASKGLQALFALRDVRPMKTLRAFTAVTDRKSAEALAKHPDVQYVKPATVVRAWAVPTGIDRTNQRALPLDGDATPGGGAGKGVVVASIDTGVPCDHAEFKREDGSSRCLAGHSTTGGSGLEDVQGHGGHTTGTAAGKTFGVLREADILSCQFLDAQGSGSDADAVECVDWTIDYAKTHGLTKVVSNNSWGGQISQPVDEAFCRADAAGVVMTAAAGNDNLNACNYSPAHVDRAITVGATDPQTDYAAPFSNTGGPEGCIDVWAPGVDIESIGGRMSGTSMADPHACGAAGQCLEDGIAPENVSACVASRSTKDVLGGVSDAPNMLVYTGQEE